MMLRLGPTLLLLCLLPALSRAADPAPATCGAPVEFKGFAPTVSRTLTRDEAHQLARLFRHLGGEWSGSLVETVCMVSGANQTRRYQAELKLVRSSDGLHLDGRYLQQRSHVSRVFKRRLLLTDGGLRVDNPSRIGEVEVLRADAGGLAYLQRYRTVHTLPQPQSNSGQQGGSGTAAGAQSQSGQAAAAGDGPVAVAGSGNLVTGSDQPQQAPEPVRRSLTRGERFTLQASDSRHLVLIQDYFTQGAYTGSMRWELQRR